MCLEPKTISIFFKNYDECLVFIFVSILWLEILLKLIMSFEIDLEYDPRDLDVFLTNVHEKIIKKALQTGVNKGVNAGKTHISKNIKKEIKLKSGKIKSHINISGAKKSMSIQNMSAKLFIKDISLPLVDFSPKVKNNIKVTSKISKKKIKRKGVSVNVTGKRKVVEKAFMSKFKKNKANIFVRTNKENLPFKMLWSKTVGSVIREHRFRNELEKRMQESFHTNFNSTFNFQLSKLK